MKQCNVMVAVASVAALAPFAGAAPNDPNTTARTLVEQCAGIKQGDCVLVKGAVTQMPLLESIVVEVRKTGAFPLLVVGSEKLSRRMFDEVPPRFDNQVNDCQLKLAGIVNAIISVDATENHALFADASPQRLAAFGKAEQAIEQAYYKHNVRMVSLGNGMFPTQATATMYGVDKEQLAQNFWSGVNCDYNALQATGARVKSMFEAGRQVRITNPNGTDFTFQIAGRPCFVSDGVISKEDLARGGAACQVWLPAGEVYGTPVAGTANGKVIFERVFHQGKEINGLTMEFKNGKMVSMTGSSDIEPLKALYDAAGPGKDEFAFFDVGINPAVKAPANSRFQSWVPAGMVTLGIGSNVWAGGSNDCGYTFNGFVPGSTVTIDDKPFITKGTLKF